MQTWTQLDTAKIPNNGGELIFSQRGNEFSIRVAGTRGELMNSRVFNSEKKLSQLGCHYLKDTQEAQVLVGGLGMGYTLAAALNILTDSSKITVAELIPEVVKWNQGELGNCAKNPLKDPRTHVHIGDVKQLLSIEHPSYDAILLDVDNGPKGLTHKNNNWLYSTAGLAAIYNALRPQGMLAIWSAGPDYLFTVNLKKAGFTVDTRTVRAQATKGPQHTIFLAKKVVA
ncbi:spermidine synthase [Paraglaciecola sp. L3A3]|uniref:spermidine synthase n=1 Tax=Paraglaciecola sp. L3A3 TaxID=2686358 RepID=UPI00131E2B73|nr:MnmC family methyltransferase [Paraglaciecola sp. L3A3]